jgi:hypothetical protein
MDNSLEWQFDPRNEGGGGGGGYYHNADVSKLDDEHDDSYDFGNVNYMQQTQSEIDSWNQPGQRQYYK